jgi:parallel beta-helix repeat protein
MSNGSYDLVYDQNPDPVRTVGNYWGYLHTDSILARISAFPSTNVLYDPVAASSRWFDVDLTPVSTCSMDVLVTGDLRVSRSLTISPGKKLAFYLIPDTSLPGGNPNLTDFIVEGSGTVLTSSGTAEDTILYHSKRFFGDFEMAGDWYGIRVKNGAEASFSYSEIRSAYCGIDVEPVGSAQVTSSRLHDCLFAGAYGRQGALSLQQSNVSFNETYGVRYEAQDATAHCGVGQCTLNHNGYAGVSLAGAAASDAPNWIQYNQIAGGWSSPLAQNGIEVLDGGNWVSVENNDVSDFSQTGIATTASSPSFGYNNVHDNHVEGIAFYEGSSPDAYGNSVTGNDLIGIACYSSSPSLRHNTVTANAGAGILCAEGSSPYVRWNSVNEHQYGVCCDATSCPDLGTEEDPGNNSILFNNAVWVTQDSAAQNGIEAIFNYWGVPDPSQYPQKFIGYIEYAPWLTSPPQGGGQQNAGVASLHLVTGLDRLQPMPMRSTARIHFQVARGGQIALSIVDASGRTIRSLVRGDREPGRYNVTWNRTDDHGRIVPAGVYFCTLSAENRRFCKKVVLTE